MTREFLDKIDLSSASVNGFVQLERLLDENTETLANNKIRMTPATSHLIRLMTQLDTKHKQIIFDKLVQMIETQCGVPVVDVRRAVKGGMKQN